MKYLLDTTLLIDTALGDIAARQILDELFAAPNDLCTCDAVMCEALSGGPVEQRATISALLDVLEYVSTTPDDARWAAASRRRRSVNSHRTLGDALIAAVAHGNQATVVTRNPRDFEAQGVSVLRYG